MLNLKKAQATYDEIKQLQLPFNIYPDDTVLLSHRGIAKIVNLEELSKALSNLMSGDIAKQIYDSLAKVAHTGSYYDLVDIPQNAKMIIKAPNGIYWQLGVDNEGNLFVTKAMVPHDPDIPVLIGPNGKYWEMQVDNDGDLHLVEV